MRMPLRNAQRNARVQLVFTRASWGCIHGPLELVAIFGFLIQQGRRFSRIKAKLRLEPVLPVDKMVMLRLALRMERRKPFVEGDPIILVSGKRPTERANDLIGTLEVIGTRLP